MRGSVLSYSVVCGLIDDRPLPSFVELTRSHTWPLPLIIANLQTILYLEMLGQACFSAQSDNPGGVFIQLEHHEVIACIMKR